MKTKTKKTAGNNKKATTKTKTGSKKKTTTTKKKKTSLRGVKGGKDNMNKKDMVDFVAAETKLTKKDVKAVIDSFAANVKDTVKDGGHVTIAEFGSWKKEKYKYNTKLNGKSYKGTRTKTKFTPSKNF